MPNLSWLYYKGYYRGMPEFAWKNPNPKEKERIQQLESYFSRQHQIFKNTPVSPNLVSAAKGDTKISLYTTYPGLLIGSGYTHGSKILGETKMGFHFDYTTGMPIIPGSSVKGLLRSAFPQFKPQEDKAWRIKQGELNNIKKKTKAAFIARLLGLIDQNVNDEALMSHATDEILQKVFEMEMAIFEGLDVQTSTEKDKEVNFSAYKRDVFHDALPTKGGENNQLFETDSITPHSNPLKNPTPLLFLKVKPNVEFTFHFDLTDKGIGKEQKLTLFRQILLTFGIGAKTNVGYGQFSEKPIPKAIISVIKQTQTSSQDKPQYKKQERYEPKSKYESMSENIKKEDKKPQIEVTEGDDWLTLEEVNKGLAVKATILEVTPGNVKVQLHIKGAKIIRSFQGKVPPDAKTCEVIISDVSGKREKNNFQITQIKKK